MGNCIKQNNKFNYKEKFLNYNIIDKKNNIVLGIYEKPINNDLNSLPNIVISSPNIVISQGIMVGDIKNNNSENIHKLIFGIKILESNKVELYFENNIKLIIFKKNNIIRYQLTVEKNVITEIIPYDYIKNLKKINNNSEHIDLIFDII
jgi:hypothetical protein